MPEEIYTSKEEATPGLRAAEDWLTLLLEGNADTHHRFKLYLVYHSENSHALKNISQTTLAVYYQ
jgi:hypothetical protein